MYHLASFRFANRVKPDAASILIQILEGWSLEAEVLYQPELDHQWMTGILCSRKHPAEGPARGQNRRPKWIVAVDSR
jgi:hypothetical protein